MKFVMIGAGQCGRLTLEISKRIGSMQCTGILDRDPSLHGKTVCGVPVLGNEDLIDTFVDRVQGAVTAIGDLNARRRLFHRCKGLGFEIPTLIDPSSAVASDVRFGDGFIIGFNSSVLTAVEISDYVLIGSGSQVLHDVSIGSNCLIGGGSVIGGGAKVGDNVSFGVGVTVASAGIRIGSNVRVAAGSVILKDVPDNSVVLGNPARVVAPNPPLDG